MLVILEQLYTYSRGKQISKCITDNGFKLLEKEVTNKQRGNCKICAGGKPEVAV